MYAVILFTFVFHFVRCSDNLQIPNAADLPSFPGTVGNIGDAGLNNGPGGFGISGLLPTTNIGPGPVGNVGQNNNGEGGIGNLPNVVPQVPGIAGGGIGNLPTSPSQIPGIGEGGIGNLPNTGAQNNGQTGIGNLPNIGSQIPGIGEGGIGNLPNTGSQIPGVVEGGIGNLPNTGSQIPGIGEGGIGNLPNTGSQIPGIGEGGIGNLPTTGSQNITQGPQLPLSTVISGDETDLERPCQVFDIYCIRRYFKNNGKCHEVRGPISDPYHRAQSTMQISKINATFSALDVLYAGLNGRIVEFYVDKQTDRLIISIEFRNVTFFSKDVYFRFFRRAREPITTFDYLYINYQSYITTTLIPKRRNLQLAKSETNTYTNDANPAISIGPNAFNYPDPSVQQAKVILLANLPIIIQESQLTEGPFVAATFIQKNICDFKLKLL